MLLSPNASQALLNNIAGKSTSAQIGANGNCWLGLFTTLPGDSGTGGVEPSASDNYARIEIHSLMNTTYKSFSLGESTATAHDRRIGNVNDINFNPAIDPDDPSAVSGFDWGTIIGIGLFTAQTGGTPYAWGSLTSSITVNTQSTFHMLAGRLEVILTESGVSLSA